MYGCTVGYLAIV